MNILEYENYQENKTHGDLIFPYNTYLCSIPLDFPRVPMHWHAEVELIYIKKGKGIVTLEFSPHLVEANTIILILPGELHSIEQYEDCKMEYENIIFHPSMLIPRQSDTCTTDFLHPLFHGKLALPSIYVPSDPYFSIISAPIDACDEICKTKPRGYELYIKGQLYLFFYLLQHHCPVVGIHRKQSASLEKIKVVIKYIENHYMDRITISEIASLVEFSESHFMRYFKDTMGTSFIDYLKDYRLTMASRLLLSSDNSILNIASEVGFDNLSYFNRAFKQKYQMTPSKFRKENLH